MTIYDCVVLSLSSGLRRVRVGVKKVRVASLHGLKLAFGGWGK